MEDPCFIDLGRMHKRIKIMQPTTARDESGELLPPVLFAERWCYIDKMTGQQFYRAQQFTSEANNQIVIRYLKGVTPNMTLVFGDRSFEILYVVNENERNIRLTLYCREIL